MITFISTIYQCITWFNNQALVHLMIQTFGNLVQLPSRRSYSQSSTARIIYDYEAFLYFCTLMSELLTSLFLFSKPLYTIYTQGLSCIFIIMHIIHFPHNRKLWVSIPMMLYYLPSLYILLSWLITSKIMNTSYHGLNSIILSFAILLCMLTVVSNLFITGFNYLRKAIKTRLNAESDSVRVFQKLITIGTISMYALLRSSPTIQFIHSWSLYLIGGSPIAIIALTAITLITINNDNKALLFKNKNLPNLPLPSSAMIQQLTTSYQIIRFIIPYLTFLPFNISTLTLPPLLSIRFFTQLAISIGTTLTIFPSQNSEQIYVMRLILFNCLMLLLPYIPLGHMSQLHTQLIKMAHSSITLALRSSLLTGNMILVMTKNHIRDNQQELLNQSSI